MAIKTGIGIGEAQVYDTSSLENNYYKLLQKQAQETAKFQGEMADLISKVKTEGARDVDKPLIAKAYDDIKELYRRASAVRNTSERNLLRSQLNSSIQSLNESAARSAEEAKLYKDTLARVATTGQFLYDAKKLNDFKSRINRPITELTVFNPLDLERIPDDSSRDKAFDNLYTELKPKAQYGKSKKLVEGKEQEIGVVGLDVIANNIMERLDKNPEWLNLATRNYIQANPGKTPEFKDIAANEVKLYMTRRGNQYVGEPTKVAKESAKDDSSNPANYQVITNKKFVTSPVYDKTGKLVSNGKEAITFDTFVTTPVGQAFATPQIGNAFNITEGKPEAIGSKKGLKITGMGVKNGNLRVTVVDDDEVEYYLKPEDIPMSIRNGNQYKAAKKALQGYIVPAKDSDKGPAKGSNTNKPFDIEEYLKKKGLK